MAMVEKELPAHAQELELESPVRKPKTPAVPVPPPAKPKQAAPAQVKTPAPIAAPPSTPIAEIPKPEPVQVQEPDARDVESSGSDSSPETINTISDASAIGVRTLRYMGPDELQLKLAGLAKRHGYFEVLFAVEKSPLYETYVQTGKKLMGEHKNFEEVANDDSWRSLLTREEFETVADILRRLGV
jgi:hypothetical protein